MRTLNCNSTTTTDDVSQERKYTSTENNANLETAYNEAICGRGGVLSSRQFFRIAPLLYSKII